MKKVDWTYCYQCGARPGEGCLPDCSGKWTGQRKEKKK